MLKKQKFVENEKRDENFLNTGITELYERTSELNWVNKFLTFRALIG